MLKQLISKDVWEYTIRTGFRFSDMDVATIIYQSELSISEKHQALQALSNGTSDLELRQQIAERTEYDNMCYERFASNDMSCFYETSTAEVTEYRKLREAIGNFTSFELALSHAKSFNSAFFICKYQIVGLCEEIILPHGFINPRLCSDTLENRLYNSEPIAEFCYDADGELKNFWTHEVTDEEKSLVDNWGLKRFERRYVRMPNPFEKGEIVRLIDSEIIGVVVTSQKKWQSFLKRVEEENLVVDFSDASIGVEFENGIHGHIQPIYLEKVDFTE